MTTSLVEAVGSSMSDSEHTSSEQRNVGAAIHGPQEDYHEYRVAIPVKADAK